MSAISEVAGRTRTHPPLGRSLRADGVAFAANRGEPHTFRYRRDEWRNVVRLLTQSGDYKAMALYRLRASMRNAGVPFVPGCIARLCAWLYRLNIGDEVVIAPGVYVPHGAIVIDGVTSIGPGCVITPWVMIGPSRGETRGPEIGPAVWIGSHASVFGAITVGRGAVIGAAAVVTADVAALATVAGIPARTIATRAGDHVAQGQQAVTP